MKLFIILLFSLVFVECAFDENRQIEEMMRKSIIKFHQQVNNERYSEIYAKADKELKNKYSEQEFIERLRAVHAKFNALPDEALMVSIKDEIFDGIRRTAGFKRTRFSHVELISDETERKATEHFEWSVINDQAKLASYEFKMICETPCILTIQTK